MTTNWVEGIDAAWGRPTPAQLAAAGKHFIVGYVSHDPAKNLTRAECAAYLDAGIAVGLVWETTSDRALAGAAAGGADGREARRQARALGFPDNRPIFTAVDFLASVGQLSGPVRQYLIAFADAVGGVALAGVYGGLDTVRYALNTKIVGWGWQTYAWSHGVWDVRAYARQYHNGVSIAGHDTDLDRAVDLSALWTKENTDMSATQPTAAEIENKVWHTAGSATDGESAGTTLGAARDEARDGHAQSEANGAALTELAVKVDALTAAVAGLPAAVVAALPSPGGVTTSGDFEVTGTLHVAEPGTT